MSARSCSSIASILASSSLILLLGFGIGEETSRGSPAGDGGAFSLVLPDSPSYDRVDPAVGPGSGVAANPDQPVRWPRGACGLAISG
jgi:hypothetical protein